MMYSVYNALIGKDKVLLKNSSDKLLINEKRNGKKVDAVLESFLNFLRSSPLKQKIIGVGFMSAVPFKELGNCMNFFIYTHDK